MARQQTGQEEKLMEVMVEKGSVDVFHQAGGSPSDRRGCFKCVVALATVMGLIIVALVVYLYHLHVFMITPSTNQDDPQLIKTSKVYEIKSSNELERHDIFTVERSANYIIFGWLEHSNIITEDSVRLMHTFEEDSNEIQKEKAGQWTVYVTEVQLVEGSRISLYVNSAHTHGKFHVYEV